MSGCLAFLLLFVGLKLGGIIDWDWWLVLSPLWIWLLIVVFLVLCAEWLRNNYGGRG